MARCGNTDHPNDRAKLDIYYLGKRRTHHLLTLNLTLLGTWPIAVFALLLIFQQSLRRIQLKTEHVLRCVVYSGDAALWLVMLTFAVLVWDVSPLNRLQVYLSGALFRWLPPIALLILLIRLARGLKLYLRFPHAWGVAVAVQCIVFLFTILLAIEAGLIY